MSVIHKNLPGIALLLVPKYFNHYLSNTVTTTHNIPYSHGLSNVPSYGLPQCTYTSEGTISGAWIITFVVNA